MTEVIAAIVAAVVAAGSTFAIIQTLARLRRKDAESEAQRILAQAFAHNRCQTVKATTQIDGVGAAVDGGETRSWRANHAAETLAA